MVIMMGININDTTAPFTDMILSGLKTIETRTKPVLDCYMSKRIGIVRTGKGKATLVGYATVGFQRDPEDETRTSNT